MCVLGKLPREKHLFSSLSLSLSFEINLPAARKLWHNWRKKKTHEREKPQFFSPAENNPLTSIEKILPSYSRWWFAYLAQARRISLEAPSSSWRKGVEKARARKRGCTGRPWLRNYFSASLRGRGGLRDARHPFATRTRPYLAARSVQDAITMTINDDTTRHDTGGWRAGPFGLARAREKRDGGKPESANGRYRVEAAGKIARRKRDSCHGDFPLT